jgi:prepilin-type N-terminal cleavage/methylation domain-containing protein
VNCRRGFTLLELLIVVLIVATLAAVSMDLFRIHEEERLQGAARLFRSDVEWARSATLSDPGDPAAIHLMTDGSGWYVARDSAPLVALTGSDGAEIRRVMGTDLGALTEGISISPGTAGANRIEFDPFGGLRTGPNSVSLHLQDFDRQCLITFENDTGLLRVSYPNP